MPYFSFNKHRIFYTDKGTGEPLILLHNGFYSSATWNNIQTKLSVKYRIITYDRFGYGQSDHFVSNIEYDIIKDGVDELTALINHLKLSQVHLLGHCLGGAITLLYTVIHPEKVVKVISSATGFYGDEKLLVKSDWTFQPFNKINQQLRNNLIFMHGSEYAQKFWEILIANKKSYIMNSEYDIRMAVKKIKCPLFIINGDRDFYFEVEHSLSVYQKMKNNSLLWIVPDTGHDVHIEKEDDFIRMIEYFIETRF